MKNFIRDNPTIALGLGLPVLLVVVMFLATGLPGFFVSPPQYDFVYATSYYENNGLRIRITDHKASATYNFNSTAIPHLWYYNAKNGSVREIALPLPDNAPNPVKTIDVNIPELNTLKLDSSNISPDGYRFKSYEDGYYYTPLSGLFFASHSHYEPVITKNGHSIHLPYAESYYSVHFIGWVLPQ